MNKITSILFYSICIMYTYFFSATAKGQNNKEIVGTLITGKTGVTETVAQIMMREAHNKSNPVINNFVPNLQKTYHNKLSPSDVADKPTSNYQTAIPSQSSRTEAPQTPGISFTGATVLGINPTNSFPPDNMGAIGPTQYIVSVNGRLVTFNKTTGLADGVLNTTQNIFWNSVLSPAGPTEFNGTVNPHVRYDRLTKRWFFMIADFVLTSSTGLPPRPNRILIALSNTSTITAATVFTYFFFNGDASRYVDFPSLGIDANALYIGANVFTLNYAFSNVNLYVVNKSSILGAGPLVVTSFVNVLASSAAPGPLSPVGVDNLDPVSTDGYFIGVDNAGFGILQLRRVSNPGTSPTLSPNIPLTVSPTSFPISIPHLGNTFSTNGNLRANDDRLLSAVIRNGHLWTSHSIAVNIAGIATSISGARNGGRWYDIINLSTVPAVNQSGTIYDNSITNPVFYNYPSVMVSGQGHAAFALTSAGLLARINASTTGRLSTDPLGMTEAIINTTASSTSYNPSYETPTSAGRRWGNYSFVSLDPLDDMTMWMIHQFCDATNSYGCQVTKLIAPPPATPASCSPAIVSAGLTSTNIILTGTSSSGSGFYDPGANLSGALPFNHITATVTGGVVVNSITYTDPTHITLNINTTGASQGAQNITVTNPDGQFLTGTGVLTISPALPIVLTGLKGKLNNNLTVSLNWSTASEYNNKGFFIERNETDNLTSWISIGFVNGAGNSPVKKDYSLIDNNIQFNKIYRYRLKQVDFNGNFFYSNEILIRVKDLQKNTLLLTSSPNPFRSNTTLQYNIPSPGMVSLKIFNLSGKEVVNLVNHYQQPGVYVSLFNAVKLSNGIYVCRLFFEGKTISNKIILNK